MRYFTKARQRTLKSCEGRTVRISDNEYRVKGYTVYKSSRKGWLCECKHYVYRQTPCSHIVYVATRASSVTPKVLTSRHETPLMAVEVKHVSNGPNKVVFGQSYNMHGLMALLTVMSLPMPSLLTRGESVWIPPGGCGSW
jgi:hypothetical protein